MNTQPLLTQELFAQLQGAPIQQIARQLGTDPAQASNAVATALPLLLGALGRNSAQPQGAEALFGALQRDHAGGPDIGSLLGAVLGGGGNSRQTDGAAILGHVLGGAQPRAAQGLGQATGLGSSQAMKLLAVLAPIVLSFLANRSRAQGLDAGGLGQLLGQERAQVRQQSGGGALESLLDRDGDGDVDASDLLNIGLGLFGGKR
ncbi:DUF937 domain-containing protein [Pseudoxanthomonas sp. J35]|uniref:DUF937 domain-containing protein n=1 Tax=Pseudoxanthomonas sp. J35 TaxID=935852 RepID=UPI00048B0798|nr:DUF937 domain-containing protein [Pseudoxanthomonas sp. J35]